MARSTSSIRTLSVISKQRRHGSSPNSASTLSTIGTRPGVLSCRAERLTDMTSSRRAAGGALVEDLDQVAAGLAQHPGAERNDEPGVLRHLDELGRGQQPPAGVLPPDQRLDPGRGGLPEVHDRLVHDSQLVGVDRQPQLLGGLDAGLGPEAGRVVEHLDAVAARLLGPVHGHVGVAQQRVGRGVGAPGQGDADAGRARESVDRRTAPGGRGRPAPARPPGRPPGRSRGPRTARRTRRRRGGPRCRAAGAPPAAGCRRPGASRRRRRGRTGR